MNYIPRLVEKSIKERLFKGKVIILYGARQVGKTTLVQKILSEYGGKGRYLNCELLSVEQGFSSLEAEKIKSFLGDYKIIVLDEAQNIPEIGKVLKIISDTYPELQIIATGSSSFDLANKISEPLTGRTFTFILHSLSLAELKQTRDLFFIESKLEYLLRFGSYPEVIFLDEKSAEERLMEISSAYLYKDILKFEHIKKSSVVKNLLQLLALQLGQEVSYNELAKKLGINRITVQKYVDALEQSFIVFTLHAFSRNMRKEISKSVKIYFYDLGIRNSLISNFNQLDIRNDVGVLWENFCIIERKKFNSASFRYTNTFFWRTYSQKEVDYVEEKDGRITGYEFKWNSKKLFKAPRDFVNAYQARVEKIDRNNYHKFFGISGNV